MVTTYVNAEIIILMKGCHGQRAVYVSLSYGLREAIQHINSEFSPLSIYITVSTGNYQNLPVTIGDYRNLPVTTKIYRYLPVFTENYQNLLVSTKIYR